MEENENQRLRAAIIEVIHNQIRDNDPPETKQALVRLQEQGFSEIDALKLIGYVVASEVFSVLQEKRSYDLNRYVSALNNLPSLPWDTEDQH